MKTIVNHPFFSETMSYSVKLLNRGLNHSVYKVTTAKGVFIARLHPTRPTNQTEIALQKTIAKLGYTPKILEYNQQMAIIEYIDGLHTSAHQWPEAELKQFALHLAVIHQLKPAVALPTLDLIQHITQYRNLLVLNDVEQKCCADVIERLEQLSPNEQALGLCHNDLNPQNIISSQGKQYLVDWEFACMGDVFFDLAGFIVEHQLDDAKTAAFLEAYFIQHQFGAAQDDKTRFEMGEKLELMKMAYRLICRLWHQIQQLE
jgi:thiamine kinase-like enzyme